MNTLDVTEFVRNKFTEIGDFYMRVSNGDIKVYCQVGVEDCKDPYVGQHTIQTHYDRVLRKLIDCDYKIYFKSSPLRQWADEKTKLKG